MLIIEGQYAIYRFGIVGNLHKNLNLIIHYCGILRLISFNM